MNTDHKKKISVITSILLSMSMTAAVTAADNDGWTDATKTDAAQNGAWEQWTQDWETAKSDWEKISLTPGADETQLNFAWYSKEDAGVPEFKFYKDGETEQTVEVTQSDAVPGYKSNKVTVSGLEKGASYIYTYTKDGEWMPEQTYTVKADDGKFSFVFFGDPQIGSSNENIPEGSTEELGQDNSVRNDSFNWNNTVNEALNLNPDVDFMVSAGDQIQSRDKKTADESHLTYTENEIEYAGYLSPEALKTLPVATTIGNHDSLSSNYSYHFNNPNADTLGSTYAGGDYYFTYDNALFIMLNTNNTNVEEHRQFIEKAVNEGGQKKWTIVTLHQDIYGSGEHSNEPEIVELRYGLVPIFEEYGVDVVLTGHDHTYARSFIMKGAQKSEDKFITQDEFDNYIDGVTEIDDRYNDYLASICDTDYVNSANSEIVVNPDGILYMTANSASGSKYYDLVEHKQSYIASRWQQDVPTFSMVDVTDTTFTINTYRTDNMEKIDDSFTIVKDDSVQYDYTIDRFGIKTQQGEELAEIPAESFIAEATITKNTDRENADYLVIASYDSDGALIGINYSYASMVQGNQYSFGTLVKNDEGNIASIKAFVWDGLSTMEPLAISAYVK